MVIVTFAPFLSQQKNRRLGRLWRGLYGLGAGCLNRLRPCRVCCKVAPLTPFTPLSPSPPPGREGSLIFPLPWRERARVRGKPLPSMLHVTILSKPGCHLCEVVLKMARRLQADRPFSLEYVDISGDTQRSARYGTRIPVVLIDQVERLSGRITEAQLRRAIKRARWRRPVSRILSRLGWTLRPR